MVGLNFFEEDEEEPMSVPSPDFLGLEADQKRRLADFRKKRDSGDVSHALEGIRSAAASTDNLLPPMIEAVKASVTLGEISEVLREEWGTHGS